MRAPVIKKVRITNFQSHRDTEICPSPGVNVITGKNMVGKTSILRALRLLLYNTPGGNAFVSWGAKNAEIDVEYGDHTVRRIKGKRTNIYEVDTSTFKSFGKGVPDEVADVLGVFPIRIADTTYELTIGGQHEPPFLVSETDATKGKIFAELAEHLLGDLVRLDKAISTANVKLRKMNSESGMLDEEITSAKEALVTFEPIKGVDKKLRMCHTLLSRAEGIQENLNRLVECKEVFDRVTNDLLVSSGLAQVYDLDGLDSQIADAQELQQDVTQLIDSQTQLVQIDTSLGRLHLRQEALKDIPDLTEAETIATELQSLRLAATNLRTIDNSIHQLGHDHSNTATELSNVVNDYGELLLEEKRCPVCFGPVTEHDAERIIEELTDDGSIGDTSEG
jgi:exonuclease SbcC